MIYRFTIISDEVDDFVREIQIDPEATFYDFHEAILKSVGYANDQMTSFFICDNRTLFLHRTIRNYHRKRYEWCQMYQEIRRCS